MAKLPTSIVEQASAELGRTATYDECRRYEYNQNRAAFQDIAESLAEKIKAREKAEAETKSDVNR